MSETRKGKHAEGKTLFGAYITPEIKALAELTSSELCCTYTDIILNGLNSEATRAGILVNGEISPSFKDAYDAILVLTIEKLEAKKKGAKK